MSDTRYRRNAGSVFSLKYHLVWCPKYRRKVLVREVAEDLRELLHQKAKELDVDCIIFDDDLSPSQQRNWEELSGLCVIDRREVILDIFSARATSREAVIQVELARMEYSLPRLTRAWLHLSRQRGGTRGTRGEGETQLEMDRRLVLTRINKLKRELKKVKQTRATMRKLRQAEHIPVASIIGYTNAGKSSLLNALSGAAVFVENKLFATLDPTTRRIELEGGSTLLLTDTVGFIRKLPHDLVETFKSTLEETRYADFLVHVLDASNREILHHYQTTLAVLDELGVADKPMLTVFNKIDKCTDDLYLLPFQQFNLQHVSVSVKTGQGLEQLSANIEKVLYDSIEVCTYHLPVSRYDLVALMHRKGNVLQEQHEAEQICITARLPEDIRGRLQEFLAK